MITFNFGAASLRYAGKARETNKMSEPERGLGEVWVRKILGRKGLERF
jgi:hypothetical protein